MTAEIAAFAKFAYTIAKDSSKLVSKFLVVDRNSMRDSLTKHIIMAEDWSSSINLFGMSKPLDVDGKSISLSISSQPRRFYSTRSPEGSVSESDVIASSASIVILGDPGAGKTTVIKRAIRRLILSPSETFASLYDFPLLVFGREINAHAGLFDHLFDAIGFSVISPTGPNVDNREFDEWQRNQSKHVKECVTTALISARVLIFIDGLDETDPDVRSAFERDIQHLNRTMSNGKIIVTCRSGDWGRPIDNFEVCEIASLTNDQIAEISNLWAESPQAFQNAVANIPYRDMLDRPLLLTLLIIYYNQTGDLPEQPVDVYQRFVDVLISDWDEKRDLNRKSRFNDFLPTRKFRFLCDAAYQLMIRSGLSRFTGRELINALPETAKRFQQSESDIKAIIGELESHTGIIVESGFEKYEFCHLTVQEFLAANYLIGLPEVSRDLQLIVTRSTATLAVAVSLSSDSTAFLSECLINLLGAENGSCRHPAQARFVKSFLARLHLERPILNPCPVLGVATLLIIYAFDAGSIMASSYPEYRSMWPEIEKFLIDPAVNASLGEVIRLCTIRQSPASTGSVELRLYEIPGDASTRVLDYSLELSSTVVKGLQRLDDAMGGGGGKAHWHTIGSYLEPL